jgi:hypothetical protein
VIQQQARGAVISHPGCVGGIKDDEVAAVETHQAFLCGEPEITIGSAGDGVDARAGQAIVQIPIPQNHILKNPRLDGETVSR